MTTYAGKDGKIDIGNGALIANLNDWSITQQGETVDSSHMGGDGWRENLHTLKSWSGQANGDYDPADTDGQTDMDVGDTFTFKVYPQGITSTYKYLTGSAIVTQKTNGASVDGKITFGIQFTGTGALSGATVA